MCVLRGRATDEVVAVDIVAAAGRRTDEKNEASKAIVLQRVEGYMNRAEELKKMLEGARPAPRAAAAGARDLIKAKSVC
jgi:hypothetical protein